MAHVFEACSNCGAPVSHSADGRHVECRFCGSSDLLRIDPAALAASLRASLGSEADLLEHVAGILERSFPEETRLARSGGFFSAKKVEVLELNLGEASFRMRREGRRLVSERETFVRGIKLKTECLAPDSWLGELFAALESAAADSARARDALKRLAGRP